MARTLALLPLVLAVSAAGCGYRIAGAATAVGDAPTVAIVTLRNDSTEPGVERLVSESLRHEWLQRGAQRLVAEPGQADWILRGRVVDVETAASTLSPVVLALEHSVTLVLALELERAGEKPTALPRGLLQESEFYLASADLEASRKNRREALRRISEILAERAHEVVDVRVARP